MRNKKAVGLSINTIVIIILAIIVLVVIVLIFSGAMRQFMSDLMAKLKNALGLWNATQVQ
ncbi:MAG: hypothetical protein IB618_03460 [Candidatus Pacearchaeota archaeon]|nr:MAG: hypothetical protein IB618_03460 [Candidatus Pacearchaeota archaeon]